MSDDGHPATVPGKKGERLIAQLRALLADRRAAVALRRVDGALLTRLEETSQPSNALLSAVIGQLLEQMALVIRKDRLRQGIVEMPPLTHGDLEDAARVHYLDRMIGWDKSFVLALKHFMLGADWSPTPMERVLLSDDRQVVWLAGVRANLARRTSAWLPRTERVDLALAVFNTIAGQEQAVIDNVTAAILSDRRPPDE
jgi:hypothetical protein